MNTNMQEWGKIFCVTTERKKADVSYVQCRKLESGKSCRAMESKKKKKKALLRSGFWILL